MSANVAGIYSALLGLTGHLAGAQAEATRAQELDPNSFTAAYGRAVALTSFDDTVSAPDATAAITAINEMLVRFGRHPLFIPFLVRAYVNVGDVRRAVAAYAELHARSEIDAVQRSVLALAANELGHIDEAIGDATESVARCDAFNPLWTRLPFATAAIRVHPRYPDLLRAMGL